MPRQSGDWADADAYTERSARGYFGEVNPARLRTNRRGRGRVCVLRSSWVEHWDAREAAFQNSSLAMCLPHSSLGLARVAHSQRAWAIW